MNNCSLMGRLTKEPVKRQAGDKTVCNFTLAVQRPYTKDKTDFINCVAWGKTAEWIIKWFSKGSMLAVTGSVQTRTWEADGQKKYATEVVVEQGFFTGEKADGGEPW